jgi:hypothetical protein
VNYGTVNGTATSGSDYTATGGTLTFMPGVMTGTINVVGIEDLLDEANEMFSVVLNSPSNATITDGTGAGTILDDDGTPTVNVQDTSASEGNQITFTVDLSSLSANPVTLDYTTVNGTATA